MAKKKKISARRKQVRENISAQKYARIRDFLNSGIPVSILLMLLLVACATFILSVNPGKGLLRPWHDIASLAGVILLICLAMGFYIYSFEHRVVKNHVRAMVLVILFIILLAISKISSFFPQWQYLVVGSAVTCAIILTIAYNQRFAIVMSLFYCILACFTVKDIPSFEIFLTMAAGVMTCCFSIKEIRTRIKLLEVATLAAIVVFVIALASGFILRSYETTQFEDELSITSARTIGFVFSDAAKAAGITILVGIIIQALLPLIEKAFRIATSMTLLDYSDANQPLLKRLAMEAPGTYSHCLLLGSICETAADSIGANGLLSRVGSYYHDIGKMNKPRYFIENQMGSASSHDQLSPAMSQLVIVGHVKDGIEMAKEYGLPAILRQFIETHHGTTLIEYFYNQALQQQDEKEGGKVSEAEFRYPGPKPQSKEAAILMLADTVEGAVRSLKGEITPSRVETVVHNMAMKRLQDGQFDECELTLKELSQIEKSLSKSLAAHYHGRIAYPKAPDEPQEENKLNGQ